MAETKTNTGSTLLAYLIQSVENSNPDLLGIEEEFSSSHEAARKSKDVMIAAFKKLERGLQQVANTIKSSAAKGDTSFGKLEPFKDSAQRQFDELNARFQEVRGGLLPHACLRSSPLFSPQVQTKFTELAQFMGEDPRKTDFEKFFGQMDQFKITFANAHESVRKEREKLERAMKKEAEKKLKDAQRAARKVR